MYKIAICDSDSTVCSLIESTLLDFSRKLIEPLEVKIFYSGKELYSGLIKGLHYDMIFLDIELKMMNGIEVGNRIRDELKNDTMQIVYTSEKDNYAMELFEIRPLHFLIKPLQTDKILSVLMKGMELSDKLYQLFEYKMGRKVNKKLVRDILYFESMNRQVRIVTEDEDIIFYGSLKEVFRQVEKFGFFYCHKSYLINYNHVTGFQYKQLTLSNKETLPISQGKRKDVREYKIKMERGKGKV